MPPGDAGKDISSSLNQVLIIMMDFKVTAIGLMAMAFGVQALRWLAGRKGLPENRTSSCSSAGPSSSSSSPGKTTDKKEKDSQENADRDDDNLLADNSIQTDDSNSLSSFSGSDRPGEASAQSLADQLHLGPQVNGDNSIKESRALPPTGPNLEPQPDNGHGGKQENDDKSIQPDSPPTGRQPEGVLKIWSSKDIPANPNTGGEPVPVTPKKKTRVKKLRFEQPDVNGRFKSDYIEPPPPAPIEIDRTASDQGTPDSQPQQSPYSDVAVEWTLPPFTNDKSLPAIPEDHEFKRGRHQRNPSAVTENGDSTPFTSAAIELASAATQNLDAQVGSALAGVGQQLPPRRHSRSYSEPNLAEMSSIKSDPELQSVLRSGLSNEDNEGDASPDHFDADKARESDAAEEAENRDPSGNDEPATTSKANGQPQRRRTNSATTLLRLEIITGPARGQTFTMDDRAPRIKVGRMPDNHVHVEDVEVSSYHAEVYWSNSKGAWLVRDMGSMNGTRLNGNFISNAARKPGKMWKLNSDDILLLGHRTSVKVAHLPSGDLRTVHSNLSVFTPPSGLQPCVTMKSEAIATLRAELGTQKAVQETSLRLHAGMTCHVGAEHLRRGQSCEDVPFLGEAGRSGAALYCVFDGHCGNNSSTQCASLLPENLRKHMKSMRPILDSGKGPDDVWEDVFLQTDSGLKTEDGTTATAVLVWKDKSNNICIQAANVGDSAAVLHRNSSPSPSDCRQLTTDHRISAPAERQRLADSGIELQEGADRLYGLNVSRCLGDHYLKDLGLIAVPSVSEVARISPEESALLVLASDGVWDVAKPSDVIQCALDTQKSVSDTVEIAEAIYQYAKDRRSRDDITIVVLVIEPEPANFV